MKKWLLLFSFCLTLIACQNKMFDKELVFKTYEPTTREYKDKLAQKIQENPNDIRYYFDHFFKKNNQNYMQLKIQGTDFEAIGFVLIANWKGLENIQKTNGKGYNGAELSGLRLTIESNTDGANLIYKKLDSIID